jgi:adenylate cyclase
VTEIPSGTITFLFTDMEGSTRLVKKLRGRYSQVLAEHRRVIRSAITNHAGYEVDTQGDAFFVAFASAKEAVLCALEVQEALGAREWEDDAQVRVRMGIHTGQATPTDGTYSGLAVHRAARICAVARGGQVLTSQATQTILEDEEEELEFRLIDLGEHRLKDLNRPVRLFEVAPHRQLEAHPVPNPSAESLPRIVVLPFTNISSDPNDEYFADGMTEELIEKLAHVKGLRVIARTTAMHYKNRQETALEIGRALRVGMALECSVRKAAERIRITAQLIETNSEEHLWSARYDRALDDVFAIQDDISDEITSAISAHVATLGGTVSISHDRGGRDTTVIEAYTDFLRGQKLLHEKSSEESIRRALGFFESALARDADFARARVGIATCYQWLAGEGSLPLAESDRRARQELMAALAQNEALAEAHSTLAGMMLGVDDLAGAAREARRAIELNPSFSDPYRWLAQLEAGEGYLDRALQLLEEAYRLDPLDVNVIAFLGRVYFYAGREAQAVEFWDKLESLAPFRINAHRTEYHLSHQDYRRAEGSLHEMERLRPNSLWVLTYRGFLAARRGDQEVARHCIETLDGLERDGVLTCLFTGFIYFALDDIDSFWEKMEQALEIHELPLMELMWSPLFETARLDSRYRDLLQRQHRQSHST